MTPPDPVVPTTTISPGDLHHGRHALHIFPQELWDKILDSYSDDKRTLRACVATCRTWRPTSRKFLWRSLSVHKSRTYPALLSLLISTPDLAQLIRELDIGVQGLKIARLAILVNLQRLKLTVTFSMDQGDQADKRGDPTPDWGVRLPSVTALDLKAERPDLSLSYTDSLLFCFPNISDLTIDSYSYILRKPHRDMTAPLLRLRKLVINDPSFNKQLPSILHSAVSLEHLELSTVLAKRDKWDFADRDRVDSWRMSEIFDLSRNPCLSSLHLRFTYDERDQWGDPWAHALRQVSAFHASLNHVMLHIGPSLGLVANLGLYERHQGLLVRELERVLSDLPQLVLVFRVNGFREPFKSVRRTFASALASPNPVAHSERLRIQFSEWTSGDQPVALESAESLPLLDA